MTEILSVGLIVCPMLLGIVFLILGQHPPWKTITRAGLVMLFLVMLSASALTLFIDQLVPFSINWIPGTGPIALEITGSGMYAILITVASGFFILLSSYLWNKPSHPASVGVLLAAIAAANFAFLTGNFLGRYVALEIVGLFVAILPILVLRNADGSKLSKYTYLIFRIGDTALLIAILILWQASNTLDIPAALAAGASLASNSLGWVTGGFLLAVWVKMGLWPFHRWRRAISWFSSASDVWILNVVMPNLGLYLLYRITPLLLLSPQIQQGALLMGAMCTLIAAIGLRTQNDYDRTFILVDATQGGIAVCMAAAGLKPVVLLLLLAYTIMRALFILQRQSDAVSHAKYRRYWDRGWIVVVAILLALFNGLMLAWLHQSQALSALAGIVLQSGMLVLVYRLVKYGISSPLGQTHNPQQDSRSRSNAFLHTAPTVLIGVLAMAVTVGFHPVLNGLEQILDAEFPVVPNAQDMVLSLIRYPVSWILFLGYVLGDQLRLFTGQSREQTSSWPDNLENVTLTFANRLAAGFETHFLGQLISGIPESLKKVATFMHSVVEQGVLEGGLRYVTQVTLRIGRGLQQWHTGKLRMNLMWFIVLLLFVVITLLTQSW